ncbi:MAG: DUF5103 domain-containing protein, partial [Saprospiraceae bacterium]|nr:DUF5103 domain-containing protein [Saprospiraceae bacterium]
MKKTLAILALLLPVLAHSQDEDLVFYDYIYADNLRSVKFHVDGLMTSMPVLDLQGGARLLLSFDDMDSDIKRYIYTVQHCDANWNPSDLNEFDYLAGFTEAEIQDYDFSFKVSSKYTHYTLALPNRDMQLRISGNYLLKVYDDEDERRLVLTRRFMVADPQVKVFGKAVRPAVVSKITTHQEIDFNVIHDDLEIRNPQMEIKAVVIQNGRWDNAVTGLKPLFSKPGQQVFDFQDKIVFPAGKEFRFLDARGIQYPDPRIISVLSKDDGTYESVLEKDPKRGEMPYFESRDINGSFVIENVDEQRRIAGGVNSQALLGALAGRLTPQEEEEFDGRLARARTAEEANAIRQERVNLLNQRQSDGSSLTGRNAATQSAYEIHNLQSEYMDVLFQLSSPGEMYDEDIYIFGGLTDLQLKPAFKMTHNPATNA